MCTGSPVENPHALSSAPTPGLVAAWNECFRCWKLLSQKVFEDSEGADNAIKHQLGVSDRSSDGAQENLLLM